MQPLVCIARRHGSVSKDILHQLCRLVISSAGSTLGTVTAHNFDKIDVYMNPSPVAHKSNVNMPSSKSFNNSYLLTVTKAACCFFR